MKTFSKSSLHYYLLRREQHIKTNIGMDKFVDVIYFISNIVLLYVMQYLCVQQSLSSSCRIRTREK